MSPEPETTKAQARHNERRERYAARAGERLRAASDCRFSLLPYEELVRIATTWYEACAEAMLRSNYAPTDSLVRAQARVAADEGFEANDLFQLLRLCRQVAIETDGWKADQFADVDAIIDDALAALRHQLPWKLPEGVSYLSGVSAGEEEEKKSDEPRGERRVHIRNKLRMPIRVRGMAESSPLDEFTHTENVAKGGLYFLSKKPYTKGSRLRVTYPYWSQPGAINHEYPAQVVRVDGRDDNRKGVAIKFLVSLGSQTR